MSVVGDRASVTVLVQVPIERCWELFTAQIDRWWRTGPQYRIAGRAPGVLAFAPGLGGELTETFVLRGRERRFVVGTVTVWEPPSRLAFEWRGVNFAPGESTEVDVRFTATASGTQVTLVHSGFATLRDDHPVRHGKTGTAFARMMGQWWGGLMTSLREFATSPAA